MSRGNEIFVHKTNIIWGVKLKYLRNVVNYFYGLFKHFRLVQNGCLVCLQIATLNAVKLF